MNLNDFFSQNGRIQIPPFRTDTNYSGHDSLAISFYKIGEKYAWSVRAQIQARIFAKFPHPQDELCGSIQECKIKATQALKNWADQNRLKKGFLHLVPNMTNQLDLFEEI